MHVCKTLYKLFLFHFCCRIDENGVIKVSDFGLMEDMYCTKYFRQKSSETGNEEKLPIKWMAPECIESNIFDESTDVVRFQKLQLMS